jgi:hypothetical protein
MDLYSTPKRCHFAGGIKRSGWRSFRVTRERSFIGLDDPPFHMRGEDAHGFTDGLVCRCGVLVLERGPDVTGFIVRLGREEVVEDAGLFNLVLADQFSDFALCLVHCRGLWFVVSNVCYLLTL